MHRLSPLDAMFLHQDSATTPRHVASLAIGEPGSEMSYERIVRIVTERIGLVPRYRQVPRHVPGGLGTPVWMDDENFDISLHIRRSALPQPGSVDALHELVGRLIARRLDHDRALWELYVIEGVEGDRTALLFKAHQSLVDGSNTVDLAQVLLEEIERDRVIPGDEWTPHPSPSTGRLVVATLRHNLFHLGEGLSVAEHHVSRFVRQLPVIGRDAPVPRSALSTELSRHRRFSTLSGELESFRLVRDQHGGTINDVILTVIAGGLRSWMLTRAEPVTAKTSFRAMVPMSVASEEGLPTSLGSTVTGHLLSLPVGESNPVVRLHQVSYALKAHRETGSAVAANTLANLPGFATSTFHAVGARVADAEAGGGHQLVITNVPGPQEPVYLAGARVAEVYPCVPLSGNRALSIGVTSYLGKVFFGLVADREAIRDVDVLAQCISDSLNELVDTVRTPRGRAPRGRIKTPATKA